MPQYCSQNWTCEINKRTILQCNSQAHKITQMYIYATECKDLNECFSIKSNGSFIDDLIFQLDQNDMIKQQVIDGVLLRTTKKPQNIEEEDDYDEYEIDSNDRFRPLYHNQMETTDNGLTWTIKTKFLIKQHHLIICISRNEIGDAISTKIIIPSELDKGKTHQLSLVQLDRNYDNEIVEGDNFQIRFLFNKVLFKRDDYILNTIPSSQPCGLNSRQNGISLVNLENSKYNYTNVLALEFRNVSTKCNYPYSLKLKLNDHPYFKPQDPKLQPTTPLIEYNLNVLSPVKPFFIDNDNQSIFNSNETNYLFINRYEAKVKSDQTIELNCQSDGRPRPMSVWFKDSKILNLTDAKYKLNQKIGSLKIFRTHPVDSGLYECQVSNKYGFITKSYNIEVERQIVKVMSKRQTIIIIIVTTISFILLVLLVIATIRLIYQHRKHKQLKVCIYKGYL